MKAKNDNNLDDVKLENKLKSNVGKVFKLFAFSFLKWRFYLPGINEIKSDKLIQLINSNQSPPLIDVRAEIEFNGNGEYKYEKYGHIPNSKSIPFGDFDPEDLIELKDKEIITICQGGGLSLVAAELLNESGFKNVKSLSGGIIKWSKKGYPLIKA